jgi:hypothetical protein
VTVHLIALRVADLVHCHRNVDERCEQQHDAWAARGELFSSWSGWAHNTRERIGAAAEFYEALTGKGFEDAKRRGVRGFRGVRLRPFNSMPMPPVPER